MVGVIVGGVLVLAAVGLGVFASVVVIRATSDAHARASVLAMKAGAAGAGRDVPELASGWPPAPRRHVIAAPARRLAVEPPPIDGLCLPHTAPAEARQDRPPSEWAGW